jgi:hypothetical protein
MPQRLAVWAGLIGPIVLGSAFVLLSILQYPFMQSLGWHPLTAPTADWPSGLALGPLGGWMIASFAFTGICLLLFARGVINAFANNRAGRIGGYLLLLAAVGMLGLSFPTDPTNGPDPATLNGRLHDLSYVVFALGFFPALLALTIAFAGEPHWRVLMWPSLVVALLVGPAFVLKGALFYGLILAGLTWCLLVAYRLR